MVTILLHFVSSIAGAMYTATAVTP